MCGVKRLLFFAEEVLSRYYHACFVSCVGAESCKHAVISARKEAQLSLGLFGKPAAWVAQANPQPLAVRHLGC